MLPEVFHYSGKSLRVVMVDGEPWWVAADVCGVLEIGNPSQAVQRLDEDERGLISIDTPSGDQMMVTVNEPGLYSLVLGSRKPEAKEFKRWITHEVLPQIRRTGAYNLEKALNDPATLRKALADYTERVQVLEHKVEVMKPKALFCDAVYKAANTQTIQQVAKILNTGPVKLFDYLRQQGFLMRNNQPYQKWIDQGLFKVAERVRFDPDTKEPITYTRTLVTGKGLHYLHEHMSAKPILR